MLSSEETARLREIEAWLRADDPVLAGRLTRGRLHDPRGTRPALLALLVGVLGMVGGSIALSGPVVAVSAAIAGLGGCVWLWRSGALD